MATLMQPLHDEHAMLLPHVADLREAADSVGSVRLDALRAWVDGSYDFLVHHLIPHAQAEDEVLYPAVERALGAAGSTATMSRDHVEVGRLTDELGDLRGRLAGTDALDEDLARDLRRVLYGLYALVSVHFAKEEEVYVPLLDRTLSADEAAAVFAGMEAAAHHAH